LDEIVRVPDNVFGDVQAFDGVTVFLFIFIFSKEFE
jgi:hypothetical protein